MENCDPPSGTRNEPIFPELGRSIYPHQHDKGPFSLWMKKIVFLVDCIMFTSNVSHVSTHLGEPWGFHTAQHPKTTSIFSWHFWTKPHSITPSKFNITVENGYLRQYVPRKNGDFPWLCRGIRSRAQRHQGIEVHLVEHSDLPIGHHLSIKP